MYAAETITDRIVEWLDRFRPAFMAVVLFVLYVLCFVYIYRANTEQVCVGLLLGLHVILLLYTYWMWRRNGGGGYEGFCLLAMPQVWASWWTGSVLFVPVFAISWVLVLTAMALLIRMFVALRNTTDTTNKNTPCRQSDPGCSAYPVKDLGPSGNAQKDRVKALLVADTVLLWMVAYYTVGRPFQLFGVTFNVFPGKCSSNNNMSNHRSWRYMVSHVLAVLVTAASLTTAAVTVWQIQSLDVQIGAITVPATA